MLIKIEQDEEQSVEVFVDEESVFYFDKNSDGILLRQILKTY